MQEHSVKATYNIKQMPFGTNFLSNELVEFNLWAPDKTNIKLCLTNANKTIEIDMPAKSDGWFSIVTDKAYSDSMYQYKLDDGLKVPDPASRYQPLDVHGPSQLINPDKYDWGPDIKWKGRPWNEVILYELHIGTFTEQGTFKAAEEKLDYLVDLGITAIELMPVADFPGKKNWGYDGVLLYAPDSSYGKPDDLKNLIKKAHQKGLMVFLDVVYNHFGPDGNYLYVYARSKFFNEKFKTPWGDAINFENKSVRDFFIYNALYWLEEYRFDGLRFDAVHAINDDSKPDILQELSQIVRNSIDSDRHIHLVLENDNNQSHYLREKKNFKPRYFNAQWNDDYHHCSHILTTGEDKGYYIDYTPIATKQDTSYYLARCLLEGFAYQGEISKYKNNELRGEKSSDLNPASFVNFIQNHDQIGNRAFGDRITKISSIEAIKAAACLYILAPSIPMLFMGEEWAASTPFLFFCDFNDDLADAVREGRRNEFAKFPEFSDPEVRKTIPDPIDIKTFETSKLNWKE
ncbi:MAG: malto-oligosyltrehalose trehalohydrolase, partial [Cyanobacteriota bacterium]